MRNPTARWGRRSGIAMGIVVLLGVAILAIGTLMLTTSGNLLIGTADAKSQLRARYAAEAMVALQVARLDFLKDSLLGVDLNLSSTSMTPLNTGNGEQAQAEIVKYPSGKAFESIFSGRLRGFKGIRVPFLVRSTGIAAGGAKKKIETEIYIYQVPIFQFGVFYQGDLEIMPGPTMNVRGPVHTNGSAWFRAGANNALTFEGPITVTGTIWNFLQNGSSTLYYNPAPTIPAVTPVPGLTTAIVAMTDAMRPAPVNGLYNVTQGSAPLEMPLGGASPHELVARCRGDESPSLRRQKFDCMAGVNRYYEGQAAPRPSYLSASVVFFDRREDRWVKFKDFDVARAQTDFPNDSIFYYSNEQWMPENGSQPGRQMITAVRLVNAKFLKRNISIVSENPVYLMGDFNLANPAGTCGPADYPGTVPDSLKYCNALIASDAFTVLSMNWPNYKWNPAKDDSTNMKGSLEQDPFLPIPSWVRTRKYTCDPTPCEPIPTLDAGGHPTFDIYGYPYAHYPVGGVDPGYILHNDNIEFKCGLPGDPYSSSVSLRINSAILTGNKIEPGFQAGWVNTIRFLESWTGATLTYRGSFICLWASSSPGLITDPNTQIVGSNYWYTSAIGNWHYVGFQSGPGYYAPPVRDWGFDTRFQSLANMPPGTPFLTSGIYSNWTESGR